MRMIAVFEKSERIRHIGHLDIQRSVQRGLRRSGIPIAYSQGFSPHILITFASALSTGACGRREIMDVTLADVLPCSTDKHAPASASPVGTSEEAPCTPEEFVFRMNHAMPPEMQLKEARLVSRKHPSLSTLLAAAEYDLLIRDSDAASRLIAAVPVLLSRFSVPAVRKTKTKTTEVDIRPLILSLSGEGNHLHTTLVLTEQESCKPSMLLDALKSEAGITEDLRALVTRDRLLGRDESCALVPLETL